MTLSEEDRTALADAAIDDTCGDFHVTDGEVVRVVERIIAAHTPPAAADREGGAGLAEVKAQALREAADVLGHRWQADRIVATEVYRALRARADALLAAHAATDGSETP